MNTARQVKSFSEEDQMLPTEAEKNTQVRRGQTMKVVAATDKYLHRFQAACDTEFRSSLATSLHSQTIKDALDTIDINHTLSLDNAHLVFRSAYGYRTWMIGPEEGIRGLLRECLLAYQAPLNQAIDNAHASMEAAAKAASTSRKGSDPFLQERLVERALRTIQSWRQETKEQVTALLVSEAEFPSRARFSELKQRLQGLMQQAALLAEAQRRKELERLLFGPSGMPAGFEKPLQGPPTAVYSSAPIKELLSGQEKAVEQEEEIEEAEFWLGWLDKLNRHNVWQRRWFAVSAKQQRLFYFKHPEEQPARVDLSLVGAVVMEQAGTEDPVFKIILTDNGAAASGDNQWHNPLSNFKTKTTKQVLTLRAKNAAGKKQWVAMIQKALQGLPEQPLQQQVEPAVNKTSEAMAHLLVDDAGATTTNSGQKAERKISTKVYDDPNIDSQSDEDETGHSHALMSDSLNSEGGGDSEAGTSSSEHDEKRQQAEDALFEEISRQSLREPTEDEKMVLRCVIEAVREYVDLARMRIAESSSKIISAGMLPGVDRIDELHDALLNELS